MPKKKDPAELTPKDPEFLPVQYKLTEARLVELADEYNPKNIPNAEKKGDEGYLFVHEKTMAITKVRTGIEAKRKELVKDANEWTKKVNGEAKRLTAIISALEKPWRNLKVDLEETEAREAEAARRAEEARLAAIEERITSIRSLTEGLLNSNAEQIQSRINEVNTVTITEELFGDYVEAATIVKNTVLETLGTALAERKAFEEQQAEVQRQQEELAEKQREQQEEQERLDKQKREQEEREAAARAEEERQAREAAEEKARIERETELEQRMPEDKKVRAFVGKLLAVKPPELKSPELKEVINEVNEKLTAIKMYVDAKTQEPK